MPTKEIHQNPGMVGGLAENAVAVLLTADGRAKTALARKIASTWFEARERGVEPEIGSATPPDFPSRPERPELLAPRDVPRRRPGSEKGRLALLHAVAHIELNAVDLHWDMVARFTQNAMPIGFYDDWVRAALTGWQNATIRNAALWRRLSPSDFGEPLMPR